jgi:hypothetical protein
MGFWERVAECNHDNLTDYYEPLDCPTPYCSGCEVHCKDCGVFISKCKCGYNDSLDGWSRKRRDQIKVRARSIHNILEFDDNPTLWEEEN